MFVFGDDAIEDFFLKKRGGAEQKRGEEERGGDAFFETVSGCDQVCFGEIVIERCKCLFTVRMLEGIVLWTEGCTPAEEEEEVGEVVEEEWGVLGHCWTVQHHQGAGWGCLTQAV